MLDELKDSAIHNMLSLLRDDDITRSTRKLADGKLKLLPADADLSL